MKKLILTFVFAIPLIVNAQLPFFIRDSINGNNINAGVMLHGDMWYRSPNPAAACEFPAGSGKHVGFGALLILAAYENGNILHLSRAPYRDTLYNDTLTDFWPGPLDNAGNIDYPTSQKWAKFWKVTRADINTFLAQTIHTTGNTPASILRWPGNGNNFAQGNSSASLVITEDMAPFYDFNNNGIYEPLLGEYPELKGEQILWWVINDNGPAHNGTVSGIPLKVQVEITAEAYSTGTLLDNVVYYTYRIKNKSGINYTNMVMGQFIDFDLGYYANDYIGYDSTFRMGYVYNATTDGTGTGGTYGTSSPVAGYTFIRVPGDVGNNYLPLGGFKHPGNNSGSHWDSDIWLDTTMRVMYQYDECAQANPPGDRHFVISTPAFNLNNGAWDYIKTALVVADTSSGNYCPSFDSATIAEVADTAWSNSSMPLHVNNLSGITQNITLYPNPANNQLTLEHTADLDNVQITICDAVGRKHELPFETFDKKAIINIATLPPGFYTISIIENNGTSTKPFLKQ